MLDPAYLALIHAEIDGELDERQRAELSRALLADPATRTMREQMRGLCKGLDALAEVEPPAQLRADILAALPQIRARRSKVAWVVPKWRFAAVLAGVLLTGTIVFRVIDNQVPVTSEMAGTLAAARTPQTVDMVQLGQGPVSGRVSLIREGERLSLTFELVAGSAVDVVVASEGRSVRVKGLGPHGSRGAGPATIALPGFGSNGQAVNLTFLIGDQGVARAVLREPTGQ